jgi:hypothetical protein
MQLIAIEHDTAGRPVSRETIDHRDAPLTDLQVLHLMQGLEVTVVTHTRRIDYRNQQRPVRS